MENGIREFNKSLGLWSNQTLGSEIQIPSGACLIYCLLFHSVFKEKVRFVESSIMCTGEKVIHNCI
jgi:hypothetical protein